MFELLEQVIVPFMSENARDETTEDSFRGQALRNLVREENKHRELFRRVQAEFDEAFGVECRLIGPAADIAATVLAHTPMAVTLPVLALEWMSQDHYVESVRDDGDINPQFKSLPRRLGSTLTNRNFLWVVEALNGAGRADPRRGGSIACLC